MPFLARENERVTTFRHVANLISSPENAFFGTPVSLCGAAIQHHAQHRHRIALPQGRMCRLVGGVEVREFLQERPEGRLLGEPIPLVDLRGVRGVERDPEEDEPSVLVTPARHAVGS